MHKGLRAFAELGYDAVSVRVLNDRLGMGHTFIHDRYGSKDVFWRSVVDHEFQALSGQLAPALLSEPEDDLHWLAEAVRVFHRASAEHPHLNQVIDYEAARESDRLDYLFALIAPFTTAVQPVFERLVAAGRIRDIPWHVFFFAITKPALLYGQGPLARRLGQPDGSDDSGTMAETILRGLIT
ncbi:TetR/AcrR family transcriptional regulator [Nocardia sp. NPDC058058]|uniref:TetR/AcrR family transcriptional regulator n=1 Tax=Nocardia sp. NPDC058058 TaxID=3346317 RepID=UPI0036DE0BCD